MNKLVQIVGFFTALGMLSACGAGRDVAVSGEVKASSGSLTGPVRVEIIDRIVDGDAVELVTANAVVLDKPGAFDATVALEGDDVLVRAINDTNNDEACSEGEAWAEAQVTISDDDTAKVPTLELVVQACPEAAKEE